MLVLPPKLQLEETEKLVYKMHHVSTEAKHINTQWIHSHFQAGIRSHHLCLSSPDKPHTLPVNSTQLAIVEARKEKKNLN